MSGFSFFSDEEDTSDNETAIEELISQAKDLSVLEQISAINCSAFSDLPPDLDSRFQKLKSLGPNASKLNSFPQNPISNKDLDDDAVSDSGNGIFSPSKQTSESENPKKMKKKKGLGSKSVSGSITIPNSDLRNQISAKDADSDVSDRENGVFSPSKQTPENDKTKKKKRLEPNSIPCPITSPSNCSNFSTESVDLFGSEQKKNVRKSNSGRFYSASWSRSPSPSPPAKSGCFLCSPKRVSKKKSCTSRKHEMGLSDDEMLADLDVFSRKERNRILKKAMEEEEKVNREADKIVKWAKQASARMNVHSYEDEEDDDHIFK